MQGSLRGSDDDHEEPHEDNEEEAVRTRGVVKDEPEANGDVVKTQPCEGQLRDWHDGLCSCHKDVGNCFLVAFCEPCAAAYEFHKHNENPFLGFCFFGPLMALIAQYRAKNGIMVSVCYNR
ncbi:unnamed protein product [Taenia asiatica]|uniref:PLAC8 family protein n=1 Tax=Taenia asiatica TaxID=60517 RepID=A0A0R3VTR9_TAEAS|nr:unnamed protein product [Taenia asiatica]